MTSELLVSALPGELRAAVRRDGILDDLLILREGAPGAAAGAQAGDLFLARVQRFDKGLDGAFVDLGLARPGLLPRKETDRKSVVRGKSVSDSVDPGGRRCHNKKKK